MTTRGGKGPVAGSQLIPRRAAAFRSTKPPAQSLLPTPPCPAPYPAQLAPSCQFPTASPLSWALWASTFHTWTQTEGLPGARDGWHPQLCCWWDCWGGGAGVGQAPSESPRGRQHSPSLSWVSASSAQDYTHPTSLYFREAGRASKLGFMGLMASFGLPRACLPHCKPHGLLSGRGWGGALPGAQTSQEGSTAAELLPSVLGAGRQRLCLAPCPLLMPTAPLPWRGGRTNESRETAVPVTGSPKTAVQELREVPASLWGFPPLNPTSGGGVG